MPVLGLQVLFTQTTTDSIETYAVKPDTRHRHHHINEWSSAGALQAVGGVSALTCRPAAMIAEHTRTAGVLGRLRLEDGGRPVPPVRGKGRGGLSTVQCSPIAVGYPPNAVGHPPTAVGYPPTAVVHPATDIGRAPTAMLPLHSGPPPHPRTGLPPAAKEGVAGQASANACLTR